MAKRQEDGHGAASDKTFVIPGALLKKVKIAGIGLMAGVLLGVGGTLFIQSYNPKDAKEDLTAVVFERIVAQNELVSVSQRYTIVDKATDANTFFGLFDIPFTENSFWYLYVGTIKAGVNLETAEIAVNGSVITVTLDNPYIISNEPDMDASGALEEHNNILNPIHVEDVDAFRKQCVQQSEEEAIEGGLLDEAKTEAENNLRELFYAGLGDGYSVEFEWRESADGQ